MDLKVIHSVLSELEDERGISSDEVIHAIEESLAHAYKKEYGKRGQIVRARFDIESGGIAFEQVKTVVDETTTRFDDDEPFEHGAGTSASTADTAGLPAQAGLPAPDRALRAGGQEGATGAPSSDARSDDEDDEDTLPHFDPEKHLLLEDAKKIKADAKLGDEITFPLEAREDFGRIAAQTAKQVLIQNIREAEKSYLSKEFGEREGEIVTGTVQRIERGNIFVDLGRATGILPYEEQIPGERYKQGERVRAYLYRVEETSRGVFLKLSRSHPAFLEKLFEIESPEVANGVVELKAIAREAGSRSKVAVYSNDEHIDPVGSLVGQRGVRVSTVMSELGGEKIDVVEWSEEPAEFVEDALSPAKVLSVEIIDEEHRQARVTVTEDQQSLSIGRGGQNVRLAAKLTGWRIDIQSMGGPSAEAGETTEDQKLKTEDEVPENTEENGKPKAEEKKPADEDESEEPKETEPEAESANEAQGSQSAVNAGGDAEEEAA
jgi:N utilization substance protein A